MLSAVLGMALGALAADAASSELDGDLFPVSAKLRPNIGFWVSIYSGYVSDQAVLHDERHLDVVYRVVELADLKSSEPSALRLAKLRTERIEDAREEVIASLESLASGTGAEDPETQRIRALWDGKMGGSDDFAAASRRVRMQIGLSDRFAEAIVRSGRYLAHIERALKAERVPTVLSRLPFVESMFVSSARSKVGASGAWQFMPGTARLYLQMGSAVDSRIDPILAASGAGRMFRHDYEALGSWPLVITAYNHGRSGVSRAVDRVGTTDLGEIVERYRAPRFGFASRNFYAEFVAAVEVFERREHYFPGVEPAPALEFEEYRVARYVPIADIAQGSDVALEELRALNPALDEDVFAGTLLVPRSYPLRVPAGSLANVEAAYAAIPDHRKRSSQLQVGYKVRRGDTLSRISRRFGTSVVSIQRANQLSGPNRIYVDQYLRIPGESLAELSPHGRVRPEASTHIVARGETLTAIAWRAGRSVDQVTVANGLRSPDRIQVGQQLVIPALGGRSGEIAMPSSHVVRRGENLTLIANRYGVSVGVLKRANGLLSSRIYPGQTLFLP